MSEFRFLIDGDEVNSLDIGGQNTFEYEIRRDDENVLRDVPHIKPTFYDDAYKKICDIIKADGICAQFPVKVLFREKPNERFNLEYNGQIKGPGLTFTLFDEETGCSCETNIIDDSYQANIKQNQEQEVYLNEEKSLNEQTISPLIPRSAKMFNPTNGDYEYTIEAYKISDVLKYLISYLSDSQVELITNYFDSGEGEDLYLSKAYELRNQNGSEIPQLSYKELHNELDVIYFLGREYNISSKEFFTEQRDEMFDDEVVLTLKNVSNIEFKTDTNRLYSRIKVGADNYSPFNDDTASFRELNLTTHREESFNIKNGCNRNKVLDLVNKFIIGSNTIEEILKGNDSFDDNIVLFQAEEVNGELRAKQFLTYSTKPYYNENLMNFKKLQRWKEQIQEQINDIVGTSAYEDTFWEYRPFISGLAAINDTGRWIAKQNYTNISFECKTIAALQARYQATQTPVNDGQYRVRLSLYHLDASNAILNTYDSSWQTYLTDGATHELNFISPQINVNAGERVQFWIRFEHVSDGTGPFGSIGNATASWKAGFTAPSVTDKVKRAVDSGFSGAGFFSPSNALEQAVAHKKVVFDFDINTDEKDNKINEVSFNHVICKDEFENLVAKKRGTIEVDNEELVFHSSIKSVFYNYETSIARFKVITNDVIC